MKVNKQIVEGRWYEWKDGVQVKVRPYANSLGWTDLTSTTEEKGQFTWRMFNYCCLDWKGLVDEEDAPYKCIPEHKKFVFDHYQDFPGFVIDKAYELMDELEKSEKNS